MTTRFDIAQYWASSEGASRWPRNSVLIDIGEPSCMACGYYAREWDKPKTAKDRWNKSKLERAHIIAVSSNGPDVSSNYVLLCESCHQAAPMTSNDAVMFGWCERRKSHRQAKSDAVIAEAAGLGIDPALVERLGSLDHDEMNARINTACAAVGAGTHLHAMTPSTIAMVIKCAAESLAAEKK